MTDETRTRFFGAIARQIPAARVIEVHLFPSIRQGGVESGVAVIALEREVPVFADESPYKEATHVEATTDEREPFAPPSRYTVYSARYRHTLKGLDRGKWEVSVTDEADAPLLTIDAVVRGVRRRSGDVDETIRLSGDEFRAVLPAPMMSA